MVTRTGNVRASIALLWSLAAILSSARTLAGDPVEVPVPDPTYFVAHASDEALCAHARASVNRYLTLRTLRGTRLYADADTAPPIRAGRDPLHLSTYARSLPAVFETVRWELGAGPPVAEIDLDNDGHPEQVVLAGPAERQSADRRSA